MREMQTRAGIVSTMLGGAMIGAAMFIGMTGPAGATPFHMITEADPGVPGNTFLRAFNSLADLQALNQASATLLGSNIGGTGVSIGGLAATVVTDIPEPETMALFALGLAGLCLTRRLRTT